jgi:hypothetical protein
VKKEHRPYIFFFGMPVPPCTAHSLSCSIPDYLHSFWLVRRSTLRRVWREVYRNADPEQTKLLRNLTLGSQILSNAPEGDW